VEERGLSPETVAALYRTLYVCPGCRGRLSALSIFLCESVFYGTFVWARRALNSPKRRFLARAVTVGFHENVAASPLGVNAIKCPSPLNAPKETNERSC
jgi:hypothetical protein